jgi:signal transduction histidine kinase
MALPQRHRGGMAAVSAAAAVRRWGDYDGTAAVALYRVAVGANPAYATTVFIACLAPLWPRRALLAMLVPLHGIYLVTVFAGPYDIVFRTVMTVGGTVVLPLGVAAAILAFRGERQAFGDMAAIRSLLEERRDMVAMVARDLQSPLAGIRALLRTMDSGSPADAVKLAEIARSCGDMYGAVAGLVEAHRHAATEQLDLADVQVCAVFETAKAKAAAVAAEKQITIVAESAPLTVTTEPSLLSAVIDNLLGNAIKYSPSGSAVRLIAEPRATEIRLGVVDNGPGIPADEVPLLFKKFSRLPSLSTDGKRATGLVTGPGTGPGLYIVRTLADRIGAQVGFAPNPGGGSIFFIDLPRKCLA